MSREVHGSSSVTATGDITATLEHFAAFIDEHADILRRAGMKPHQMRSGCLHAIATYRTAVRGGNRQEIAAAEAEANRILKGVVEGLVGGVSGELRRVARSGSPR